jgi:hypothetical protein
MMAKYRESIAVSAPPERAWRAVVAFEERPRYSSRVKEAEVIGGGPLKVGSTIRLQVDRDRFTPSVTAMDEGRALTLVVKGPGFRATHHYGLQAKGGTTELSLTGQFGGLLGGIFAILMGNSVRRDLRDELAAIKAAAEARA